MWSGGTTVLMEELVSSFSDGEGAKAVPGFVVGIGVRVNFEKIEEGHILGDCLVAQL